MPGTAKAGDDLVGDEQDVVLVEHLLQLLEVTFRRHQHATGAHDGLGDERSYRFRALFRDQGLDLSDHALGEGCFALPVCPIAVVVRA